MDTTTADNELFVTNAAEAARDAAIAIGELADFDKCWGMEMSYGQGWNEVMEALGEEATKALYAATLRGGAR